jgi:hypothetical protein
MMIFLIVAIHEKKIMKTVDIILKPLYTYSRAHINKNRHLNICYQYIWENLKKLSAIFLINKRFRRKLCAYPLHNKWTSNWEQFYWQICFKECSKLLHPKL